MKIRITGTESEVIDFANELNRHFDIISVSMFYTNNRKCLYSNEGRLYIEIADNKRLKILNYKGE